MHFEDHVNESERLELISIDGTESVKRRAAERRLKRELALQALHIAKRLRAVLDALGMSQKDLADRMGVSPQQVNKYARGTENPTIETLAKLKLALGFPLIQVVGQENEAIYMVETEEDRFDGDVLQTEDYSEMIATQKTDSAFDQADENHLKVPA